MLNFNSLDPGIVAIVLPSSMSVEIVGYANMVRKNSFNKVNYTILGIVGMGILECNTFIIGTIHWFNIISRERAEDKNLAYTIYPVLALVAVGLTASSTYEAVDLWKGGYDSVDGFRGKSEIYQITLLVEAIGWGIHSLVVTICGIIL